MRGIARWAVVVGLLAALALPTSAAAAQGPDDIIVRIPERASDGAAGSVSNAQLRWGLNLESGGGAFFGGCNFLSAGRAGDAGSSHVWTDSDAGRLYRVADGRVRIEYPTAAGGWERPSYAERCLKPDGTPVSSGRIEGTGGQVVMDGGTGQVGADGLELRWSGSFTVVFYGGMTYWSVTDPTLVLDAAGNGRLTATASGYGAARDGSTPWHALDERSVVLAEVRAGAFRASGGFSTLPAYLGVPVESDPAQARSGADWGSFPQSFVDFQQGTGQAAYWYSSGGVRDPAKPATTLYVSYDADAPIAVTPPPSSSSGGTGGTVANNTATRPAAAAAVAAPAVAASFTGGTPFTFVPEREGLVPQRDDAAIPPVVLPLLGSAVALLAAIVAVLNLMGALPWQRTPRP